MRPALLFLLPLVAALIVHANDVENGGSEAVLVREKRVSSTLTEKEPSGGDKKPAKSAKGSRPNSLVGANADRDFPLVMPSGGEDTGGSCLLYMESVQVIVYDSKHYEAGVASMGFDDKGQPNAKYAWGADMMQCLQNKSDEGKHEGPWEKKEFSVNLVVAPQTDEARTAKKGGDSESGKSSSPVLFQVDGNVDLTLHFAWHPNGHWNLTSVTANQLKLSSGTMLKGADLSGKDAKSMKPDGFAAYYDYAYACSGTSALAVWPLEKDGKDGDLKDGWIGIGFGNVQFQPYGVLKVADPEGKGEAKLRFGPAVVDCVGFFSVGSWMGVIVTLLLITVLLFGFMMLNSVQSVDRFDDVKQRQLIINAKE